VTEAHAHNSGVKKLAVQWFNEALCFYQSLCLVDGEELLNRHLRVAANRYLQGYDDRANHQRQCYIKTTKCQRFVKLKEL
jgi:hypothetical protein